MTERDFDVDTTVAVGLDEIADGDFEEFLDLLERRALKALGLNGILTDIQYEAVGVQDGLILIKVMADVYSDDEDEDRFARLQVAAAGAIALHAAARKQEFENATKCDECGEMIPSFVDSHVNEYHADMCSLFPGNVR